MSASDQFLLLDLAPPKPAPKPKLVEPPLPLPAYELNAQRDDVRRLRASLEASIASQLSSGTELIRALEKERRDEMLPTTIDAIDSLLGGGLARGKMTELAGRNGDRFSIVLSTLAAATSVGEAAALIDLGDHFDPQLGEAAGIDLRRLLWIRPKTIKQAAMAVEMIAACAFQLVVLDAGLAPVRGRRVPDAAWVRLARTAESHGAAILISAPYALTGTASEALMKTFGTRGQWLGRGKAPRVLAGVETRIQLERHRRIRPGHTTTVTFRTAEAIPMVETNKVASPLATRPSPLATKKQVAS